MYQRFIAVGRLGRDPEISTTPGGTRIATMSLATSEYVKGEERTEWHRVTVWDDRLIDVIERRAKRGSLVAIEGQVRTRRWLKDGREMLTTEIVLDRFTSRLQILANGRSPGESGDLFQYAERSANGQHASGSNGEARRAEIRLDDEIPF